MLYKQSSTTRLTTTRAYDLLDRLQSVTSTPAGTNTAPFYFGYIYNELDQRVKATGGDGSYWSYAYDGLMDWDS